MNKFICLFTLALGLNPAMAADTPSRKQVNCSYSLRLEKSVIKGSNISVPANQNAEDRLLSFSTKCLERHRGDRRLPDQIDVINACVNASFTCS